MIRNRDNIVLKNTLNHILSRIPDAAKAGFVFLICAFLQKGVSTITTPVFTRILSPDEYGTYNVFISWSSIIAIFITLKIPASVLQQAYIKFSAEKDNLAASMQGLSFTLCLVATLVYLLNIEFWNRITGFSTDICISMIIGIWATNVYEIWAQKERTSYFWKNVAIITVLTTLFKPIFGVIAILMFPEQKVKARIISLVIIEVIFYIGLFFIQIKKGDFYVKKFWKYSLLFAFPLIPHYLSQQVLSHTDRLMINYLCGSEKAGIYSLAYQVAMVMTLFNSAMSSVLNPWIYKRIKDKAFYRIAPVVEVLMMILMFLTISMILFAPEIIRVFAPMSYYQAILAIPPVCLSSVFMFLYGVFVCFEFYYEKRNYIVYASAFGAILNVVLNACLIPFFGFMAASYTTLICYIVFCGLHYIFMHKTCIQNGLTVYVFNVKRMILQVLIYVATGLLIILLFEKIYMRIVIFLLFVISIGLYHSRLLNVFNEIINKKD